MKKSLQNAEWQQFRKVGNTFLGCKRRLLGHFNFPRSSETINQSITAASRTPQKAGSSANRRVTGVLVPSVRHCLTQLNSTHNGTQWKWFTNTTPFPAPVFPPLLFFHLSVLKKTKKQTFAHSDQNNRYVLTHTNTHTRYLRKRGKQTDGEAISCSTRESADGAADDGADSSPCHSGRQTPASRRVQLVEERD